MRSLRLGAAAVGGVLVMAIVTAGVSDWPLYAAAARQAPPPTFRASTDVVAIDVQVVDKNGQPILDLTPADFTVRIDGHARSILSSNLIRYDVTPASAAPAPRAPLPLAVTPTATTPAAPAAASGRYIILAIDALSFDVAGSRNISNAADRFVQRLAPADRVGVFSYPLGPKLDPTTDHAAVQTALGNVMGQRDTPGSGYLLTPSEVVDLSAGDSVAASEVLERVCGIPPNQRGGVRGNALNSIQAVSGGDCQSRIAAEITTRAQTSEAQIYSSQGMLGALLRRLGGVPGRKIVVLVSAGSLSADRPGARPDASTLPTELGRQAARSNVAIYTLFIDQSILEQGEAENRHGLVAAYGSRDAQLLGRWLDQFSGASGGTLLTDQIGSGDIVFDRILSETSAYYLLGVQPDDKDRDGRTHALTVKVNRRGVTVRSRAWATIPKPPAS